MSATLMRVAVLVFSGRLVVTPVSATTVGASLTSVTVTVNAFSVEKPPASVDFTRIE